MKLFTYVINGTPVNELNSYLIADLNGYSPYLTSTASSIDGYVDISSMENWDLSNTLDWSRRRDEISPLFYAEAGAQLQNFAGMSIAKKLLACKYFLIPYNVRIQIISDSQDLINWDYLLKRTKESRESCVEAMRIKVGQYMRLGVISLAQTQDFYKQVYQLVIWFNESNAPDFKQWLSNEAGSPYENAGFAQMLYYIEAMKTDLIDIYNGNY
jgi:hypothetical protein